MSRADHGSGTVSDPDSRSPSGSTGTDGDVDNVIGTESAADGGGSFGGGLVSDAHFDPRNRLRSSAYALAAELDAYLGDPLVPGTPHSYREIIEGDELGEFPAGARGQLVAWGFHRFSVPVRDGGRLRALDELLLLTRTLSRRNVGLTVAYGSAFLAGLPTWLFGRPGQRRALAAEMLAGGLACFGVSEPDHGSDIGGNDTVLERVDGRLRLTGTKWPVGNAIRANFVTVLGKSGPGAFSLVLVDKRELAAPEWSTLPMVRTVGLRGHDLSGIEFHGADLPESALLGRQGRGLLHVMAILQVTRTAIAGLSLGTMDAVLRIALDHAVNRRLYGASIFGIPVVRKLILDGHLDLLAAECTALPLSRALSILPERMSLWSAVVKYFAPVIGEDVVKGMSEVLSARGYLREGVADGVFQKLQRDHAIASIFEGTTHVNLSWIDVQLSAVAKAVTEPEENTPGRLDDDALDARLADLFSQTRDTPDWIPDPDRHRLSNSGFDEITQGWTPALRRIVELADGPQAPAAGADLVVLAGRIDELRAKFYTELAVAEPRENGSVAGQEYGRKHCVLHAISSAVLIWLHNRDELGGLFASGEWLALTLQRLLWRLDPAAEVDIDERNTTVLIDELRRCAESRSGFDLMSLAGN